MVFNVRDDFDEKRGGAAWQLLGAGRGQRQYTAYTPRDFHDMLRALGISRVRRGLSNGEFDDYEEPIAERFVSTELQSRVVRYGLLTVIIAAIAALFAIASPFIGPLFEKFLDGVK
ncbi:hypothetical protein [Caulobacter sp. NIBR1757]|uniref:hypothetical protein n=1 Tax=Caulobacter sp. NIBR1757 TaxID=3016000 RepID=UPI0022F096C4|nr:hypothetical protein [Caulobacter sp. NIBR1757]WGM39951.1 hypothetical protein AMEJIAPC_02891 [Caulobacter sp. NIBR1757]